MARKSKNVKEERAKAEARLNEIDSILKQAEVEEQQVLEIAEKQIKDLTESKNIFCGVILTKQDVLNVLSIILDTHENVKIPFRLYYND